MKKNSIFVLVFLLGTLAFVPSSFAKNFTFEKLDANGDGKLTKDEAPFPGNIFEASDSDRDGNLSRDEFKTFVSAMHTGRSL